MKKHLFLKCIVYVLLIFLALSIAFPIYVTFVTAFKTTEQSTMNFFSFPTTLYLDNFIQVMSDKNFVNYVCNSILITAVSIVVISIEIPLVSYVIARNMGKSKYFSFLYIFFICSVFAPFQALMIPLTQICYKLNIMNQAGVILLYITFALGQGVFLFAGFYKSVPIELEEAASIDGCGFVGTFFKIVYPLAKPMTMTVIVLNTLWIWNDFLLPILLLNKSAQMWTLPIYQYNFKSAYLFNYNLAFASFMFSIVPMMILYICVQKYIIEGLTAGAIKS